MSRRDSTREALEVPTPVFVGFFPKRTAPAPAPLAASGVREIASVSLCISPGPFAWIERWSHNRHGFYDTEAEASVVSGSTELDIYAYELYPIRSDEGRLEAYAVKPAPGEIPRNYGFLGFDVVSRSASDFFECSPLSCNLAAADRVVNEYCLLTDVSAALDFLREVSKDGGYEPGPYFLFRIWRKLRA